VGWKHVVEGGLALVPARQLLVIRKIRERDDFRGRFVVPSREFAFMRMMFFNRSLNVFPLFL
jgi:hypothetical protein